MTDAPVVEVSVLRRAVQEHYAEVATHPDRDFHFHTGRGAAVQVGYPDEVLDDLPADVVEGFAGVAYPFHFGFPRPGERVLDIGSGAGVDALIAARAVGPTGAVIGVDITPEMLERATENAERVGLSNVEFREGLAEGLPVEAGWADLVISNGVLNLVLDKIGAYRQIFRALRPGGRFQIADICVDRPVSERAKRDIDLWTG